MLNPYHLHDHVVVPVLKVLEMDSPSARAIVMGTAAKESGLRHIVQLGGGPGSGVFQVEPFTATDCIFRWVVHRPIVLSRLAAIRPEVDRWISEGWDWSAVQAAIRPLLVVDLAFCCAMCRLKYRRVPKPLPDADDIEGLASYWKRYYNTAGGAGTEAEFIRSFRLVAAALKERAPHV